MKSNFETYTISMAVNLLEDEKINLNHFLQRESGQWSSRQQVRLIDTLLKGYPMPAIYAIKEDEDSDILTVLDGKQRLSTLKAFFVDEAFAYKCKEPVVIDGEEYDVNGLKFSQMPRQAQRKLTGANFTVVSFTGYSIGDVLEVFERLNDGTPLTKAEKSKPLMGDVMISNLRQIIETGFFEKTGMKASQLRKGEAYTVLLQCLMLLKMPQINGFSSANINRFIVTRKDSIFEDDYKRLASLIEDFGNIIDKMDFGGQANPITKVSIAPVVYVLNKLGDDREKRDRFALALKGFFENYSDQIAYAQYCHKTTDKAQVEGRIREFERLIT